MQPNAKVETIQVDELKEKESRVQHEANGEREPSREDGQKVTKARTCVQPFCGKGIIVDSSDPR